MGRMPREVCLSRDKFLGSDSGTGVLYADCGPKIMAQQIHFSNAIAVQGYLTLWSASEKISVLGFSREVVRTIRGYQ